MSPQEPEQLFRAADFGAFFRPSQIEAAGLTRNQLPALVRAGKIERVGRGLYRVADSSGVMVRTDIWRGLTIL